MPKNSLLNQPGDSLPNKALIGTQQPARDYLSLDKRVLKAQVAMLFERNFILVLVSLPFAFALCWFGWGTLPAKTIIPWLIIKTVTTIFRLIVTLLYRRRSYFLPDLRWAQLHTLVLTLDGAVWGLFAIFLASIGRTDWVLGSICVVMAVGAIGSVSLSPHYPTLAAFLSLLLLPPAAWYMLALDDQVNFFLSICMLLFFGLILVSGAYSAQMIKELLRLQFQMSNLAEERAEALAQAAQSSNVKNQFLANMSHEIRTPFNAIIGISELLVNTKLDKEQQNFVEVIRSSSHNLLTILNEILDFSKIESGKLELEYTSFDLQEVIEQSMALFRLQARNKDLQLNYLIDKETKRFLRSDITRLSQILTNLIGNAIKFTHKGEIMVSLSSTKTTGAIYEYHFQVKDTGIGISVDQIDKLFQLFSQADPSTTRKYGGTGLGLAISKRLTELLGGRMWVESEVDKGSTFHFTIVAQVVDDNEIDSIKASGCKNKRIEYIAKEFPLTILVAEDNIVNQQVALNILKKMGYQPDVVSNGREVLNSLEQRKYDLILMDVQMPEMDGISATYEICQRYAKEARPKIIAMTAGAMNAARQQCLDAGMDDFLTKPVDIIKLQETLSRCQPMKQSREEPMLELTKTHSLEEPLDLTLNYATLEALIFLQDEDDPHLVTRLINIFIIDSKKRIEELTRAVNQNDLPTIRKITHAMVSSSGNLGADRLTALCRQLEDLAIEEQTQQINPVFTKLLEEFEQVCLALKVEQQKLISKISVT